MAYYRKLYKTKALAAVICGLLASCATTDNAPAPVVKMGQKNSSAGVAIVRQDDTLWHIAKRFNLPMRDIITINQISHPFIITEGQRLQLPPPREYKVRAGDTLYEISRMFETDMNAVARLNDMRSPYTIRVGQVLRMPSPNRSGSAAKVAGRLTDKPRHNQAGSSAMQPHTKPKKTTSVLNLPQRSSARFALPVQGRVISSYGPKKNGLHNDGINIAAPRGAAVKAAENGIIAYTGDEIGGYGNLILIRHEGGYMTAYAHLGRMDVKRGMRVNRGQVIGTVGATGNVDSPQLHFEIRKGSKALNPQSMI